MGAVRAPAVIVSRLIEFVPLTGGTAAERRLCELRQLIDADKQANRAAMHLLLNGGPCDDVQLNGADTLTVQLLQEKLNVKDAEWHQLKREVANKDDYIEGQAALAAGLARERDEALAEAAQLQLRLGGLCDECTSLQGRLEAMRSTHAGELAAKKAAIGKLEDELALLSTTKQGMDMEKQDVNGNVHDPGAKNEPYPLTHELELPEKCNTLKSTTREGPDIGYQDALQNLEELKAEVPRLTDLINGLPGGATELHEHASKQLEELQANIQLLTDLMDGSAVTIDSVEVSATLTETNTHVKDMHDYAASSTGKGKDTRKKHRQ